MNAQTDVAVEELLGELDFEPAGSVAPGTARIASDQKHP